MKGNQQTPDLSFIESVLENLQDEVYVYACDTLRVRYMNAAACKRIGWTAEQYKVKCISDTVATFNVNAFRRRAVPLLDGTQDKITLELMHPSGPIEVSTKIVRTQKEGNFFLSVIKDLSSRKTLENAKLQTVSTVSHELRTPLTSIHGALRLLNSGTFACLDENTQNLVDIASRNTDRLLLIVNDILDFEKIKANKMDFSISEMDITKCVDDTVELMSGFAAENDVKLEVVSDFETAIVLGNPNRLAQVITNFVSNAIKYSPKGATVTLRTTLENGSIKVAVSDHGPGISEEHRKALFKPFSQPCAADGSNRPGTGLGLAIVASILNRLEYPVDVTSVVGEGSTFAFRIPPHLVIQYDSSDRNRRFAI